MSADSVGADECETCFRIVLLAEVRWRFRQYDLERRSNMAAREMACESSAVATPEHRMNMNRRLTVGPNRNVAVERSEERRVGKQCRTRRCPYSDTAQMPAPPG